MTKSQAARRQMQLRVAIKTQALWPVHKAAYRNRLAPKQGGSPISLLAYFFCDFFGLQEQSLDGLPQVEQTPFSIGAPQTLHGVQPQVWHIRGSFSKKWFRTGLVWRYRPDMRRKDSFAGSFSHGDAGPGAAIGSSRKQEKITTDCADYADQSCVRSPKERKEILSESSQRPQNNAGCLAPQPRGRRGTSLGLDSIVDTRHPLW